MMTKSKAFAGGRAIIEGEIVLGLAAASLRDRPSDDIAVRIPAHGEILVLIGDRSIGRDDTGIDLLSLAFIQPLLADRL